MVRHVDLERDILANQPPQDVAQVRDGARQVDALAPRVMLVAEREKLPRQTGAAVRGAPDLLEILVVGVAARVTIEQQIRISQRHGQKVVEIVRDASYERPMASIFCACRSFRSDRSRSSAACRCAATVARNSASLARRARSVRLRLAMT